MGYFVELFLFTIVESENRKIPGLFILFYSQMGPCPMQLVVPMAVRKAVSAATITFTASSMILCFFISLSRYRHHRCCRLPEP